MKSEFLVYYGHDEKLIPQLKNCELLIFEKRGWTDAHIEELRSGGAKLIAYLSPLAWPDWMGSVKWWWGKKSRDEQWDAWWMSMTSRGWRHQVSKMWKELRPQVDGIFFDNLDRLDQDPKSLDPLLGLFKSIRADWPEAILVGNRGFSNWSRLGFHLDAVLFENMTDQAFSAGDRKWVQDTLEELKMSGTRILSLDYHTRTVPGEVQRLRGQFEKMSYYCAPDESLMSLS